VDLDVVGAAGAFKQTCEVVAAHREEEAVQAELSLHLVDQHCQTLDICESWHFHHEAETHVVVEFAELLV